MKKHIFTITLLSFIFFGFSQKRNHEKIKAYKTAFITDKLDLTVAEAEKFWPIYNAFTKKEKQIRTKELRAIRKKIKLADGIETFTEKEATTMLTKVLGLEEKLHKTRQGLYLALKPVLSSKKILKLHVTEKDFNRKLLRTIRDRRLKE